MLAVAGGKGGCGKTTTTLGLAVAAARLGRSVLAVDADVDVPDLHRVAGVEGANRDDRQPVIAGEDAEHGRIQRAVDQTVCRSGGIQHGERESQGGSGGIDPRSLPGTPDVHVLPARPGTDPESLRERIDRTARTYDLVLVDCPAGGGRDAAVPLRAADRVVLVTTAGEPSLRDAAKTGAMASAVGTPVAGAVLTRAGGVPEGVDDLLGTRVVEAVPRAGKPLRDGRVTRRYARILRRLAVG